MASAVLKAMVTVKDNDSRKLAPVPGLPGSGDVHPDLCSWPTCCVAMAGT